MTEPVPDKKCREYHAMRYKIIYADPPWSYQDKAMQRGGAERHYRTVDHKILGDLDIGAITDDDAILFMWATFPKIGEALELIRDWGFEYKTNAFTWVKRNRKSPTWFWGMGRWTRANAEVCLLATKGKPKRVSAAVHSIVDEPVSRHSEKPRVVKERIIQLVGDLPRLEMFCRGASDGWDVYGNEAEDSVSIPCRPKCRQ